MSHKHDFRVGDRVRWEGTVCTPNGETVLVTGDTSGSRIFKHSELTLVSRAPRPIAVGDKVRSTAGKDGIVEAINDVHFWVRLPAGNYTTWTTDFAARVDD